MNALHHGDRAVRHVVALTGGIASGKTAVSDRFAELGVAVVDTDLLAREIVQPGADAWREIGARFGPAAYQTDGNLDRAALRRVVFSDPAARRDLERITHPRIAALARQRLDALDTCYAVLVVPLLAESSAYAWVDRVLVVIADPQIRLQRLVHRDQVDIDQAQAVMAAQKDDRARLALADDVLHNDASLAELRSAVDRLHVAYRSRFNCA